MPALVAVQGIVLPSSLSPGPHQMQLLAEFEPRSARPLCTGHSLQRAGAGLEFPVLPLPVFPISLCCKGAERTSQYKADPIQSSFSIRKGHTGNPLDCGLIVYYGIPGFRGNKDYFAARFEFHFFLSYLPSQPFQEKNIFFALEANNFKMLTNHIFLILNEERFNEAPGQI